MRARYWFVGEKEIFQSTMTNHYLCFIIVRIERKREVIKVENTVEYEPFFFNTLAMHPRCYISTVRGFH